MPWGKGETMDLLKGGHFDSNSKFLIPNGGKQGFEIYPCNFFNLEEMQ